MPVRGVRGATTVPANDAQSILSATEELLAEMAASNGMLVEDVAAVLFTTTRDLDAAFPAKAARLLGWQHVPLLDAREIPVHGSLPRCIRVLLLWNTDVPQCRVAHIYLREAQKLRQDLARSEEAR
ncbi:MAG TPA: chorismate mutase [Anaerolineae bacterium]|nr:chorismate mutase [Anaerolineae bacterium]